MNVCYIIIDEDNISIEVHLNRCRAKMRLEEICASGAFRVNGKRYNYTIKETELIE